ncbi:hypothetical protein AOQ84DRAFT_372985 [Glonium stellatum]|uniref:Uncharacterized protein n=1 Tax=Glonium stellatum TaxID=574774 RepID=A0A8E2F8L2_9PEZI|nr:hypothetical protein AOQ84DRAFT_372985 [Glonium stellatum]
MVVAKDGVAQHKTSLVWPATAFQPTSSSAEPFEHHHNSTPGTVKLQPRNKTCQLPERPQIARLSACPPKRLPPASLRLAAVLSAAQRPPSTLCRIPLLLCRIEPPPAHALRDRSRAPDSNADASAPAQFFPTALSYQPVTIDLVWQHLQPLLPKQFTPGPQPALHDHAWHRHEPSFESRDTQSIATSMAAIAAMYII